MGEPVRLGIVIQQIMKGLEKRRSLEKQFASMPKGKGRGLSPRPAGIEAGIGGKYGKSAS